MCRFLKDYGLTWSGFDAQKNNPDSRNTNDNYPISCMKLFMFYFFQKHSVVNKELNRLRSRNIFWILTAILHTCYCVIYYCIAIEFFVLIRVMQGKSNRSTWEGDIESYCLHYSVSTQHVTQYFVSKNRDPESILWWL